MNAYVAVQSALDTFLHGDVDVAAVRHGFDHGFHSHFLACHNLKFILRMRAKNDNYHKLLLIVLRLCVDVVLKEFGRGALDVSTVLPLTENDNENHDFMHQLIDQGCVLTNSAFRQRTDVLLMVIQKHGQCTDRTEAIFESNSR